MSRFLIPALLAIGAMAAEPAKEPPAKLELFAKENWYKNQEGKETEFVGVLMFKDRGKNIVGFGRFNPYTLVMGEGDKKTVREVYVGGKPELLKQYIGKTIKLVGKAVDMDVEGKNHREIWAARLEVVVVEKKPEQARNETELDQVQRLIREAKENRRQAEEELAKAHRELGKLREEGIRQNEEIKKSLERLKEKSVPADVPVKILARTSWTASAKPGTAPLQLVIRSPEELAKVTGQAAEAAEKKLAAQFKVKKIDWKTQMVVVATAGAKPTGGYEVAITSINITFITEKMMAVDYRVYSPAQGKPVTQGFTHPAQAVLCNRYEGKIFFLEWVPAD